MVRQSAFFENLLLPLFLAGSQLLHSLTAPVRIVPESVRSGKFEVRKGAHKIHPESREAEVEIKLSKEKTVTWYVSMLYDPQTRLFWWNSDSLAAASARRNLGIPALLPRDGVICLTDSKFVMFWNGWVGGGSIFIRESSEQYSSMDEGQSHVLQVLEARRPDIEAGKLLYHYKEVKFPGLNKDFLYKKYVANAIGPTLKDVAQVGDEWHVVEDGPNGGSALIVLSNKYEVLKTTILPSK
jgi:hypothetical protein